MGAIGTAIIDFGPLPGTNEAFASVTGETTILGTSVAEAFIMGDDSTADHTAQDHRYIAALVGLSCGTPAPGIGFSISARSTEKLTGEVQVRWVWV